MAGSSIDYSLPFFDVGIGGDGLRGPVAGTDNIYQQFLVHTDALERWEGDLLLEGGKHYGHLEVDVFPVNEFSHKAILTPVYILPLYSEEDSAYTGFERRQYNDQIILSRPMADTALGKRDHQLPGTTSRRYPNPFHTLTTLEFWLSEPGDVKISIWDDTGRLIHKFQEENGLEGSNHLQWNGQDQAGNRVSPGLYLYYIETESGESLSGRIICAGDRH